MNDSEQFRALKCAGIILNFRSASGHSAFVNNSNKCLMFLSDCYLRLASRTWRWKKGHSSRSQTTKGKNEQVVSCNTDSKSVSSFYTRYKPIAKVLYNSSPSRCCYCESPVAAPAWAPLATSLLGGAGESKRIGRNAVRCSSWLAECKI